MDEEHVFNVGDKVMLGPGAEDELDAMYVCKPGMDVLNWHERL